LSAHLQNNSRALLSAWQNPDGIRREYTADGVRLLLLLAVKNADKAPKPAAFEARLAMMYAFAQDVQLALGEDGDKDAPQRELAVDIGLTTQPYFNDKSRAIYESGFYSTRAGGLDNPSITSDTLDLSYTSDAQQQKIGDVRARYAFASYLEKVDLSPEEERLQEAEGTRRTPDQGTAIKHALPERGLSDLENGPDQIILAGFDTLIRIFNPKYYGSDQSNNISAALTPFFQQARLRITIRPDVEWGSKEDQLGYVRDLTEQGGLERVGGSKEWADRIEVVEADGVEGISSTTAREATERKEWKALLQIVPVMVVELIKNEDLYASR
jgi:nicotinamide-nucleotide adenylyltransferase